MSENLITVEGASDDLIEISGLIDEEFNFPDGDVALLGFSNGVLLEVRCDEDGKWRIRPLSSHSLVTVEFAPEDEADGYSDKAHLHTAASWVLLGSTFAKAS